MNQSALKLHTVTDNPTNKETPLQGLQSSITPNDLFYIRNHFDVPEVQAEGWRLSINGAVSTSSQRTLEQIKALPQQTLTVLLECAGNGRTSLNPPPNGTRWNLGAVSQAEFTGASLKHLLDQIEHDANVIELLFTGADAGQVHTGEITEYARSLPLAAAQDPNILLCWEMNGEPLSPDHGYPLRLIVPDWYGMASVKWLKEIAFITEPFQGFFQAQEYVYMQDEHEADGVPVGKIKIRALVSSHQGGTIKAGKHNIEGVAWSGEAAVDYVELSLDDGASWQAARLAKKEERYGWVGWTVEVLLKNPGAYTIIVKATDTAGNTQPLTQRWNKGGYVNNMAQRLELTVVA